MDIDGTDNVQCLEKENGCRTISYIIDNECVPEVHLVIHINYHEDETYTEPCNDKFNQSSCECFVTVFGDITGPKPQIVFAANNKSNDWPEECNIFLRFLSSKSTNVTNNLSECSAERQTRDQKIKLKFKHLVIVSLVMDIIGMSDFSAENVDFVNFRFSADASSNVPCLFHCDSCTFSSTERKSSEIQEWHIELSHCLCVSLIFRNSSFSQTEGSSSIKVLNPGHDGNNSLSVINIENCSVINILSMAFLQIESTCAHRIGTFMQIFLENSLFERNRVSSSPVVIHGCAEKNQLQIEILLVSKCSFSHNFGEKAGVIDLYSVHASLLVTESQFKENIGGSVGLISFEGTDSYLNISITASLFYRNIGEDVGAINIDLSYTFLDLGVTSSEFVANTGKSAGSFLVGGETGSSVSMSVVSSEFCENTATLRSSAGFVNMKGSESYFSVSMSASVFVGNSGGGAGLIYIETSDSTFDVSVTGSKIWKNTGSIWWAAGVTFVECSESTLFLSLTNMTFLENAGMDIGITKISVFICTLDINVTHSKFVENSGRSSGSFSISGRVASYIFMTVINSEFYKNTGFSEVSAGSISLSVSVSSALVMHVISTSFVSNRGGEAGCVSISGSGSTAIDMRLSSSEVRNNTAFSVFESGAFLSMDGWQTSLHFLVSNCEFCDNNGGTTGSLGFVAEGKSYFNISLVDVSFSNNSGEFGGAIEITSRCSATDTTVFLHTASAQFIRNIATKGGSAIHILNHCTTNHTSMIVSLNNTDFFSNVVPEGGFGQSGGTFCVSSENPPSIIEIQITHCKFESNTASTHGGALALDLYESSTIYITQSQFQSNKAAGVTSDGGACYFSIEQDTETNSIRGKVQIYQSIFEDNIAADGGSVFQTSHQSLETELDIQDTTFFCCNDEVADFISLVILSKIKNTQFHFVSQKDTTGMAGIYLKPEGPYFLDNVFLSCETTDIIVSANSIGILHQGQVFQNYSDGILFSLSVRCAKCVAKPFPAGNGGLHIMQNREGQTPNINKLFQHNFLLVSPCQPCPFGGDCSNGNIKALPNYWGYRRGQLMFFLSCPPQYCCNGINVPCDSFDTCAPHRTGQLCGQCEDGFTESLMSAVCIANELCDDWWVWLLGFVLAFAYLLWYMYRGTVFNIFPSTIKKLKCCARGYSRSCEDVPVNAENAFFDILVYFSNIISLLKVQVQFQNSDKQVGMLKDIEKYFMKYLDVDVQHILHLDLCPFAGLNITMKTLARPIFTLMVFLVWCTLYSTTALLMHFLKSQRNVPFHFKRTQQFKYKLLEGFVETSKYSYSGFAGATFLLLACVDMRDKSVWKYDAEIECYSILQKCVFAFAAFYVVPFVFISPIAGKLLRAGAASYIEVMLACVFPFPLIAYWGLCALLLAKSRKQVQSTPKEQDQGASTTEANALVYKSEEAQVLLDTYQGAFKEKYCYWEGVIELRKLVFCSFYLIQNNIFRLVSCTILSVICLLHHKSTQPFAHKNSNRAETLSLSLLCIACTTNCIKSVFAHLGEIVEPNTPTEQLLLSINRFDRVSVILLISFIVGVQLHDGLKKLKKTE